MVVAVFADLRGAGQGSTSRAQSHKSHSTTIRLRAHHAGGASSRPNVYIPLTSLSTPQGWGLSPSPTNPTAQQR
jgi:hypothetical protein